MKTTRDQVLEILDRLPQDATLERVALEINNKASVLRGLEDARQGRVTSHEEVKERLKVWRESPGRTKPFDVST